MENTDRFQRIETKIEELTQEMRALIQLQERQINLGKRTESLEGNIEKLQALLYEHERELHNWRHFRQMAGWGFSIVSLVVGAAALKYFGLG